jgi:Tfp pilus assembly protein PilV
MSVSAQIIFMQIKNKKLKAFSFVEVMISVFLLSIGMVAIITLMSGSLRDSLDSRNQIIASGLAQEGTELARNMRDSSWLSNSPSTGHSFDNIPTGNTCRADKNSTAITCGNPYALLFDGSGYYTHTGTTPTKFQRRLIVQDSGSSKIVTSLVSWNNASPPNDPTNCNTSNQCAFAQINLTTYGEHN